MERVEEGEQVLAIERDLAPIARADDLACYGIDENLVVAELELLAGRGIAAPGDAQHRCMAFLELGLEEGDAAARVIDLDAGGKIERREVSATALDREQLRVQPLVEFMIPRDQRAGRSGDEEEHGDEQAGPAVDEDEEAPQGIT